VCVYCAVRSVHTVYLCVLCGSENKQRLLHCTALTDCFSWLRRSVYCAVRSAHTEYLCFLCGSENKQRLFPYIEFSACFYNIHGVSYWISLITDGVCLLRSNRRVFKYLDSPESLIRHHGVSEHQSKTGLSRSSWELSRVSSWRHARLTAPDSRPSLHHRMCLRCWHLVISPWEGSKPRSACSSTA
jgi:hypothetical protein